ncbi:aspartate/glutamate racemase family protein [Halomonas sp.]|uniref:aspartate/glutamate racemase family protein n=1 Tax=Halomonas sp. TaxID=1486246 RepID=UPI0032B2F626
MQKDPCIHRRPPGALPPQPGAHALWRGGVIPGAFPVLAGAADKLAERGAEVLVLACTELSEIGGALDAPVAVVDRVLILAEQVVRAASDQ